MSSTEMTELMSNAKALQQSANDTDTGQVDGYFMKFTKFGVWEWGQESQEIEEDSQWLVHPGSFAHGWIGWGNKEQGTAKQKLGEEMVAATKPLPKKENLPEIKGNWMQQTSMQMLCISGEDKGTKVVFNANSVGGRKIYKDVVDEVVKALTSGKKAVAPVLTLSADSYEHKEYGKIFTPDMEVVEWCTMSELEDLLNAADSAIEGHTEADDEAAAEALAQIEEKEEPVQEAVTETEATERPARQRRQRSARTARS